MTPLTTVFLSYSWDSDSHKRWVRRLAEVLEARGVAVNLDQIDLRSGSDLTQYMETAVRESDFVLLVCTPGFAARANARSGGVGYEQSLVTGEILSGVADPEKFIPILRGPEKTSIPSFLRSRLWIDFRDDSRFEEQVSKLVSDLGGSASRAGPARDKEQQGDSGMDEDLQVYSEAEEFARSKTGLAAPRWRAEGFVGECQERLTLDGLHLFIEVFEFANQEMGFSRGDAEEFAWEWVEREDAGDFDAYADFFEFVTASDGMNLRPSAAREFVRGFDQEHGLASARRFSQAFQVAREAGKTYLDAEAFALDQL